MSTDIDLNSDAVRGLGAAAFFAPRFLGGFDGRLDDLAGRLVDRRRPAGGLDLLRRTGRSGRP